MQNNYFDCTDNGETHGYTNVNEIYDTTTYRDVITDEGPTDKSEPWTYSSSNNNIYYNTQNSARNSLKPNIEDYLVEDQIQESIENNNMVPNAVYENTALDEAHAGKNVCNYLKEKSNSIISGTWVPKKPKVFVRRIDGSKCPPKETVYQVVNGHYNTDKKSLPYDLNSRDAFVKQKIQNFQSMPCEYIGASTKRIISPEESEAILRNASNNREALQNFCVVDNYQTYKNVPLCVRETSQIGSPYHAPKFPIQPLIQDEYYFRHVMSQASESGCVLTPENVIKFLKIFLKCFSKTMKLVIHKIRTELDTTAFPVIFPKNTLPNMDIACNVCEKTEEQRIAENNRPTDFLSHFEGVENHTGIFKRIFSIFETYDKSENDAEPVHRRERMEPRACYQAEVFPKDKNGKVMLPSFDNADN